MDSESSDWLELISVFYEEPIGRMSEEEIVRLTASMAVCLGNG